MSTRQVPEEANVVIIGGGIIGVSIAYHLGKRGVKDVILLEKNDIAAAASGLGGGSIRPEYPAVPEYIKLLLGNLEFYKELARTTEANFYQGGSLLVAFDDQTAQVFEEKVKIARGNGVEDVRLLTPTEARQVVPDLGAKEMVAATYCPSAMYTDDQYTVARIMAEKARRQGVRFYTQTEVDDVEVDNCKVNGVNIRDKEGQRRGIRCNYVVNAAGAWAMKINGMVGMEIPVDIFKLRGYVTTEIEQIDYVLPVIEMRATPTSYQADLYRKHLVYAHSEEKGIYIAPNPPPKIDDPDKFAANITHDHLVEAVERILYYFPTLDESEVRIISQFAAPVARGKDGQFLIGKSKEVEGFLYACGFSAGFMSAPGIGRAIAELIVDGAYKTLDLSQFDGRRFTDPDFVGVAVDNDLQPTEERQQIYARRS